VHVLCKDWLPSVIHNAVISHIHALSVVWKPGNGGLNWILIHQNANENGLQNNPLSEMNRFSFANNILWH